MQKSNIETTLRRILEYAKSGSYNRPLVIRTDSVVTTDILREVCEKVINGSKKVSIGLDAIIEDGLNIVYNYDSCLLFNESVEQLKGKKYIIIVDRNFEPNEEVLKGLDFIDCFNEKALTVSALYSELKSLPEDLYIFASKKVGGGLLPIRVNAVTPKTIKYMISLNKLRSVKQMLDELEPIKDSDRAVFYDSAVFVGIEEYNPKDDYAIIEMETLDDGVDKLVNTFKAEEGNRQMQ